LPIDYQKRDGVAYITLNNPKKANILDKRTSDEISKVWIDLWEDRKIRCAILTARATSTSAWSQPRARPGCHTGGAGASTPAAPLLALRDQHGQKTGVDGRMGDHYPRVWKPVIAAVNIGRRRRYLHPAANTSP
jgi:enoyl-CoA hydratase/E-phenylitaconyl-CoA hydratase/naphthyl-2-hydroxymethylsuccinyl-CoA hydratase